MVEKNSVHVIEITGTGSEGEGVGKVNGFAVFVPFALMGETVEVLIVKSLKHYAFGKLISVLKPSPHRQEPECRYFYKCGGCSFWHTDYKYELEYKTRKVSDCMRRIAGIDIDVPDTLGAQNIDRYRNKGLFAVNEDGVGFYAPRSHRMVAVDKCLIQSHAVERVVNTVKAFMDDFTVPPYNEEQHSGVIRNIMARTACTTGETMAVIVTRTEELPFSDELVKRLIGAGVTSVIQNVNTQRTNVALGNKNILLHGKERITDVIDGLSFEISPYSFYQVNTGQTKVLYDKVVEFAGLLGNEAVYDLYCGIGTITMYAGRYAKKAVGVEYVADAVLDGRKNAKANGFSNMEFVEGKAEDIITGAEEAEIVIVDPPRKGCDEKLLKSIANSSAKKVVYVSCNPATLARDVKIMSESGFKALKIQPVDMFPRTHHVETVVLMSRVDK